MNQLRQIICDEIGENGPMTIERYMDLALQHPEHGYYRVRDPLGASGDFTTSPEISQMFGELIGLWCVDIWWKLGSPKEFTLLELGPGRGTLMRDALRGTARAEGFQHAARLHFLESNAVLRVKQMDKLAEHNPVYLDDLSHLPKLPTLVIANEFFDALPIRQFVKSEAGWRERLVGCEDGEPVFTLSKPDKAFELLIPEVIRDAVIGAEYELSPLSHTMTHNLSAHISRHGGAALIVDYGYGFPPGHGTFQATNRHRFEDVLADPGNVDLTAYVDFSMLKRVAERYDVKVSALVGQGDFLRALGIEFRAAQLKHNATPEQCADIDTALRRLTDADQMGAMFKVMGVMSPSLTEVAGFP